MRFFGCIFCTFFIFRTVWCLGGVKYECPGNQIWVYGTEFGMPTCGNQNPESGNIIYGGCRCPFTKPYLKDNGVICTDSCPISSTRKCPSNQEFGWFNYVQKTCVRPWIITDFLIEKCGCAPGMLLDIDGQTCVEPDQCPPICAANQWLNMIDGKPCTKTCSIKNPPCDDFHAKRCECPNGLPFLSNDGVTCVTEAGCDPDDWFPTGDAPNDGCPGNQVLRIVNTIEGFGWPNNCCTKTCSKPEAFGCPPIGCNYQEEHCACPDNKPILGPDGINCIEEKFCPMRSCFANQVWTSEGKPCDYTCELDENDVPCSSFNAFRCECPEGTYLSEEDGCSCINCCPDLFMRLDLKYGVTDYKLKIKKNPDNLDPQMALKGSGGNIKIVHKTRYRIRKPRPFFLTKKICFATVNVKKAKFFFYDGDDALMFEKKKAVAQTLCYKKELLVSRVDIKFFAEHKQKKMKIYDLRMQACEPLLV